MKIQSLSVVVPTKGCINNCKYCVSRTHKSDYNNIIEDENYDKRINEYLNRLYFVKENGVNNIVLTGEGEALQNEIFLEMFSHMSREVGFRWVELQTSGNMLLKDEEFIDEDTDELIKSYPTLSYLKGVLNVSTISLSLSNIFDSKRNQEISQIPEKHYFEIDELCRVLKKQNFNLRLSLNMTSDYDNCSAEEIFERAKELGADQITFRKLYKSDDKDNEKNKWIENNSVSDVIWKKLNNYIMQKGNFLGVLPFGSKKFSVSCISTVVDDNCMDDATKRENIDTYKYLILRPDCKLYSNWNDKGSLVF